MNRMCLLLVAACGRDSFYGIPPLEAGADAGDGELDADVVPAGDGAISDVVSDPFMDGPPDAGGLDAGCIPTGQRAAFNTLSQDTASGCWNGNPCAQDQWVWTPGNGQNFQATGQYVVCSAVTACVGHVGIGTYSSPATCQGDWSVFCDATKVGTINTSGNACTGSAMTNGCSVTFKPASCSSIRLVAGAVTNSAVCCGGGGMIDSTIVAVSAW